MTNLPVRPSPEMLARALISTSDRYADGYMTRATFEKHMRALWAQVDAANLRALVLPLIDPQSARRLDA